MTLLYSPLPYVTIWAFVMGACGVSERQLHIATVAHAGGHNHVLRGRWTGGARGSAALLQHGASQHGVEAVLWIAVVHVFGALRQRCLRLALLPLAHHALDRCVAVEGVGIAVGFFAEEAAERQSAFARLPVLVSGVCTRPVHVGRADHAGKAANGLLNALTGWVVGLDVTVPFNVGGAVVAGQAFCGASVNWSFGGGWTVEHHKTHLPAAVRAEIRHKSTGNTNRVDISSKSTLRDGKNNRRRHL